MNNKTRGLGNLTSTGALTADIVNGRIGIGSTTPRTVLDIVGIVSATSFAGDKVQVGSATTIHTTGIDLGSGNITSNNINSTGIITATSFVGQVTGNADTASNLTGSPSITVTDIIASGNVSIAGTLTYDDVTNIDSVGVITARAGVEVGDVSIAATITSAGSATFNGTVAATSFSGDGSALTGIVSIPVGGIIMWSGSIASIPSGWALCDGTNGTPNLQDRFVIGAGSGYAVDATGGSADATVVSHSHTVTQTAHSHGVSDPGHAHGVSDPGHAHAFNAARVTSSAQAGNGDNECGNLNLTTSAAFTGISINGAATGVSINSANANITIDSAGSSGTSANLPPYYALAYIMKT